MKLCVCVCGSVAAGKIVSPGSGCAATSREPLGLQQKASRSKALLIFREMKSSLSKS